MELYPGLHAHFSGSLLEFSVRTEAVQESIFSPTDLEIEALCEKYEVDPAEVFAVISKLHPQTHTLLINLPVYKQYLREKEEANESGI